MFSFSGRRTEGENVDGKTMGSGGEARNLMDILGSKAEKNERQGNIDRLLKLE